MLRFRRDHRLGDVLDQIAVHRNEARAAFRPQRRRDAGRAPAPIIAREHRALDPKRIHQRDQVGADRRLFARARRRLIEKTGWAVAAQIGNNGAAALGGQPRRDIDIGMNVVGKAVQQHHDRAVRGAFLVVGDVEHAGIDVTKRLQPARGRRARGAAVWSASAKAGRVRVKSMAATPDRAAPRTRRRWRSIGSASIFRDRPSRPPRRTASPGP